MAHQPSDERPPSVEGAPAALDDLRSLLDHSPDIIARYDRERRAVYMSAGVEAITGHPPAHYIGHTAAESGLPPRIADWWDTALDRVFETGEPGVIEFELPAPGGARWLSTRLAPERTVDRTVRNVVTVSRDLTGSLMDRHQAETALEESEVRYRSVLETAGSVVVGLRPDHTVFEWNHAAEDLFGARRAEVLGVDYLERFVPAALREAVAADVQKVLAGSPTMNFENEVMRPDGHPRTLLWNVTRVLGPAGHAEGIIAIGQDITERKQAERALRQSEERIRAVFESMPVVFVGVDDLGLVRIWNAEAERVTGYGRDEIVGNERAWELLYPDADYRALVLGDLTRLGGDFRDREYTVVRTDGSRRTLAWSSQSRLAPLPGLAAWSVAVDVTERLALEAQFRHAQKMEAVGQLAGGIAHDFNNLLTAILSNAELAMAGLPPTVPARSDVEEIARAARRAGELTRKLLTFSRKQVLQVRPLDLNAIVLESQPLLRRLLGETITLDIVLHPTLDAVRADPSQLELVLVNLVVNARDAMPAGGMLTIETAPLEGSVTLAVRDTGVGMDPDTQAHIFEPFFTTKAVGQGTGLGLAMVYGVVTQSGGTIHVDSAPGCGSSFRLVFPRSAEPATVAARPQATMPRGQETVLLVEDESAVRTSARRVLERHGYAVIEARHGADALRVWRDRRHEIDVVLSDVRMPEMGGPELAAALRKEAPLLPVVFMTGYATREATGGEATGTRLGSLDPVLEKPFEIETLLRGLRAVLDAPACPRR